jgi:hypothetical protein
MKNPRWLVLFAALAWLLFYGATLAVPVHVEPLDSLGFDWTGLALELGSLVLGITALLGVLLAGERPTWPAWSRYCMFGGGLAVLVLLYSLNWHMPWARAFSALALMALALPVGYWIGDRMERVTNLLPLAVAMSMADIFSVFQGPTRQVAEQVERHQQELAQAAAAAMAHVPPEQALAAARQAEAAIRAPLADYAIVYLPVAGTGAARPVLGIGDFIILAFLLRAAYVHRLHPARVFVAGLLSLLAALLTTGITGVALPALPFVALGTVGYLTLTEPRLRKLSRQEITLTIIVAVLFIALIAGRWMMGLLQGGAAPVA